jgi:hypothetical protein
MSCNMDPYFFSHDMSFSNLGLDFSLPAVLQEDPHTISFDNICELPTSGPTRMLFDEPETTSLDRTSTNCPYRTAECS